MSATLYVALLRGINVGGRNRVTMADLPATLGAHGYGSVRTYIHSGNVVFASDAPRSGLERDIEVILEQRFGFPIVVVVRSTTQLRDVVAGAPDGFGSNPDVFLCDVVFLKQPLTLERAMSVIGLREGVDQAWPGSEVLYFARLNERRT